VLNAEGIALFRQLAAGRAGHELMLPKADGAQWGKSHQSDRMAEACTRAAITPSISFHGLRHSYASLSVMAGVPLIVVARNLGHSDTRMVEVHYGHLAESFVTEAIRAGAPTFGFKLDDKVVTLS
jgi:integrase